MSALYFVLMYSNGGLFFEVVFVFPFNIVIIFFNNIVTVAEHCYCNRVNIYIYIVQQGTKKNIHHYFMSSFISVWWLISPHAQNHLEGLVLKRR